MKLIKPSRMKFNINCYHFVEFIKEAWYNSIKIYKSTSLYIIKSLTYHQWASHAQYFHAIFQVLKRQNSWTKPADKLY